MILSSRMPRATSPQLSFADHGAQYFAGALLPHLDRVKAVLADLPPDQAGIRLRNLSGLSPFLEADGPVGALAAQFLGDKCRAARAILFDKTAATNWSLAWHQDRTICVKERREVEGFGPWTVKQGMQHVAPPFALLARMVTLRVHLDPVSTGNAPLRIAPGSHLMGRVVEGDIDRIVRQCGVEQCLADAGDIWLYATPILHASDASVDPTARRVLQVDFSADKLPGGLEWLGV